MAQNNETRVPKTSTFEEWRQSTNRVSFDVGPVESNDNKTSDSLDKETRLTDQAKTVNVTSGAASTTSVDVGASAPWRGFNDVHSRGTGTTKGGKLYGYNVAGAELPDQKFSVATDGDITLAPNTEFFADDIQYNGGDIGRNAGETDGNAYLVTNTFQENLNFRGKTVTFAGTIDSTSLNARYDIKAFVHYLDSDNNYNLVAEDSHDLRSGGSFDLSLSIPQGSNIVPQVGFQLQGVNAKAATSVATTSVVLSGVTLAISAGANEIILGDEEFIRDQSLGANSVGIRIDTAPDQKLDMTAGYIVLDANTPRPADFASGNSIEQYTGDNASNAREFSAQIVTTLNASSNVEKILITNVNGTFNPSLKLGSATNYSTQSIAANKLIRQVTGLLDFGYVRVYKTVSGTTTKLVQSVTEPAGFHLPRATFALPLTTVTGGSAIPATYKEGERIYQTTNNLAEAADNVATFTATILTATPTAAKYGLGAHGGIIMYDTNGTFDPSKLLRGTTTTSATIAATRYTAAHTDCVLPNTFSSMIRLNSPAQVGETYEVEFASVVDAIVELQDDIGTIEDLVSNTTQAGFGASASRKTLNTADIVTVLNTLQDMIGNSTMPTITNNIHLTPAKVTTISDAAANIVTMIGDTNLSDAALGATADAQSTITAAITAIKSFIGSVAINDLGVAETVTGTIAQLHDEVGDVTTLDATASTTAGGFDTEVLTTALIELRTLVCPGDIDAAATALSANDGTANGFAATTNTDGIVELQTIVGDRVGISTADLIGVAAASNTIVGQINRIKAEIGTAALGTTAAGDIASAINELETNIRGGLGNYTIDNNLNTEATYVRTNGIIDALNDLTTYIGNTAIGGIGAETTITSAVNKMHAELGDTDSLNVVPTTLNVGTTDGVGGFRITTGSSTDATVVSALTELRQALVGDGEHLAVVGSRTATTRDAYLAYAKNDLNNAAGYDKRNVIDSILEIQDLIGDVTSLDDADNLGRFNTANIVASLVELRTAIVGDNDLTDTIATLDDDSGSTDYTSTNLVTAITEIQAELGQVSLLTATPFHADLHGSYANTDFQIAINAISAAIGNADIGAAINSGDETLTNAIEQLRIDIGDAGSSGAALNTATKNVVGAINELNTELGDVADINNATGYVATSAVTGITEIQGLIGNPVATAANLGAINTRVQKDTGSEVNATETTIPMGSTTGIVVGMTVSNIETGRTGSIAAGTKVTTVNAGVSVVVDTDVVSTINSGDTLRFDVSNVVNAINAIDSRIGSEINAATMGTTAATLVPAIKEITDELGAVTAGNLGTTSSTITTAIKEVVAGTGAATVTVKGVASQQPTGKLDRVSGSTQTIISDINFNAPGSGASEATTITLGTNTILDVSSGVLKMSTDAAGVFNVSSAFIQLLPSSESGTGLQIDRSGITGVSVQSSAKSLFQWQENAVSTNNPAAAHNQSDIAWRIKGLTSVTSPQPYTLPNVDFQNAYRLFGIGTEGVANSMTNVTVAWDSANHNFDISLNDSATDMTSGSDAGNAVYGTTAKIPQITVDRQGRISAMDEVDMANFLGTFNVLGDSGTQSVATGNSVKVAGTAGEITTAVTDASGVKTVTIGLPDNVDVDGTLTVGGNIDFNTSGTIALGDANTEVNVPGELNVVTLNVSGLTTSSTVSNTTISGDAFVLRAENSNLPAGTDTPKFVVSRGFATSKTSDNLVTGKRYKIVSGTGFTDLGANNNTAGTIFTATGSSASNTGVAKEQRNEAAVIWSETADQFVLTRGGVDGAISTNTQQGAIIAQGDTIGSATKFTATSNANDEDKQVLFADVTDSTSKLQRNAGLLFNPSTNKLTLGGGQLDLSGYFKHLDGVTNIHTNTNAKPLHISRDGSLLSQLMKVGVSDREVIFNYIEDTSTEGKNVFGSYKFLLNGNHGDADEVADRVALIIDKDRITTRGLRVNTNGIDVTGTSDLNGALNHIGFFTQERHDVDGATVLGHELNNRIIGAHFQSKVTTSGQKSILQIEDRRSTAATDGAEVFSSSTKGIQHRIDGTYMSFLDFQATNGSNHQAILGGISHGTRKTYISGNGVSATKVYNNINSGTASELVFETKAGGVIVNGNLDTDSADVNGNLVIKNAAFPTAQDPIGGADSNYNLAPASPLHILKRNADLQTDNVLATFEVHGSDYQTTPGKISIDFKGQDTNNKTNFARISQATVNDTDYGDNNEGTSNLIFGATSNGVYGEKMIMTGGGKVGIGTLNPTTTLEVAGEARASAFSVIRDEAAAIYIRELTVPSGENTNSINQIILTNSTNADKAGIMRVQSKRLGTTAGNSTTQAVFVARNGNTSYLQVIDHRDSNGNSFTSSHKRLEFGTDSTRQGYIAQNLNGLHCLEIGSSSHGGGNAAFASQPWIAMKKAASGNGPGAVELYHGNAGTSSLKLETLAGGAKVTGQLSTTGKVGIGTDSPANDGLHITNLTDSTIAGTTMANAKLLVGTTATGIGLDNNEIVCSGNTLHIRTLNGSSGHINFGTGTNSSAMVLTDGGNVGINVGNEPAEKLDVGGNIKLSGIIDQNGTGTNDFEGQIDCNQDVKTTGPGKGFYAFGGGSDYLTMTHDGSGGHITSSDKLEIETPIFEVRKGDGSELMIKAVQDDAVTLYNNNVVRLSTNGTGVRIGNNEDDVAVANYVDGGRFNPSTLEVNRITFDSGLNSNDNASITFVSTAAAISNRSALDIKIGDDVSNTVSLADKIRMRMQSGAVNGGAEYSLVEISGKGDGSTRMDLTLSPGTTSEVIADTFTGALAGNASTASTLSATLTVAKGGTGATAFADKSVIISQDSGTDTLSAVTMSTNGQLLIGGTSGPTATTLTAGNGIDVTNGNGTITVAAELASSSNTGVAKFDATQFSVASGNVTIKALGVANSKIANDAVTFSKMQNVATDTIMGRTLSGTGDAKAMTASEARGVLNVANGADNYGKWKLQANGSTTTDIGASETVNIAGSGATSVARSGNTINITSTNTTYSAQGGTSSNNTSGIFLNGTKFQLGSIIKPYSTLTVGSSQGTYHTYNSNGVLFSNLEGSSAYASYQRNWSSWSSTNSDTAPPSNYGHLAVQYLGKVIVKNQSPTRADELTAKSYVDSKQPKMAACTHSGSSALNLKNCSISRTDVGRYTLTLSTDKGAGSFPHIVASLQNNYSTGSLGGKNSMNPGLYSITARRNGSSRTQFFIEIVKLRSYSNDGGGNDHNDVANFVRDNVDLAWSCLIYNGEGD